MSITSLSGVSCLNRSPWLKSRAQMWSTSRFVHLLPSRSSNPRPALAPRRVFVQLRVCFRPREHVPEPQGFVPRPRHHGLPIGRYRQVKHPQRVPGERRQFAHSRVPPHHDLVLRVPVRAYDFVYVFRPHQVTHLTPGINARKRGVRGGVPEPDTPVRRSATRTQQTVLVRRPRDRLHRGGVVRITQHRVRGVGAPNHELVIVPAGREFAVVVRPLQPAHFAFVA
mmetsp:Transcript_13228/g.49452  ORF Transcript_13228/g.49452 Transcript_13228/m.49452 type:complete len:225 (+) Transcript_13228:462-1136(+)